MSGEGWPADGTALVRLRALAPWLVILVGVVVLTWPIATQWREAWEAGRSIDKITATYDTMNDPERSGLREEARRYNQQLATGQSLADRTPYIKQLSFRDSDMIAFISVPKCSIKLPIFHGTEDKVLMAGVGHLAGTSLPVGGESSHCVLTAHTGMPGRRMFDDIHLLEPGDEFVIWELGEPLAYRVYQSEVVLPDQTESLSIVPGRDLCTLVTCTPYRVNTHRLLVHAERCEYQPGDEEIADVAVYVNGRTLPLLVALVVLVMLALVLLRRRLSKRA